MRFNPSYNIKIVKTCVSTLNHREGSKAHFSMVSQIYKGFNAKVKFKMGVSEVFRVAVPGLGKSMDK